MQYNNPLRSFHLLFALTLFVLIRHPAAVTIIEILAVVGVVIWAAGYRLIRVRIQSFKYFTLHLKQQFSLNNSISNFLNSVKRRRIAALFPGLLGEIGLTSPVKLFGRTRQYIWRRDKTGWIRTNTAKSGSNERDLPFQKSLSSKKGTLEMI